MTTIELVANDQLLQVTVNPTISSGEQNTVEVHVDFSDDWDGFSKSAVFFTSLNKNAIYEIVMTDGKCIVPSEVMTKSGILYIGIRGVNSTNSEVKTTSLVKYKISEGTPTGNSTEIEPTPDVYQQLLTAYGKTDSAITKEVYERKTAIATEKAERQTEIAVERNRITNLATLSEGSTTADAELLDIRVKADGSTATSAGNAVREQVSELKGDLKIVDESINGVYEINYEIDKSINEFGELKKDEGYLVSEKIPVNSGETYSINSGFYGTLGERCIVIFDSEDNKITWYNSNPSKTISMPANASYIICTFKMDSTCYVKNSTGEIIYEPTKTEVSPSHFATKDDIVGLKEIVDYLNDDRYKKIYENKSIDSSGETYDNDGYFATDFIEVTPGQTYKWKFIEIPYELEKYCLTEYNKDKHFITYWNAQGNYSRDITITNDTKYIRATFPMKHKYDVNISRDENVIWKLTDLKNNFESEKINSRYRYTDRSPQFIGHGYGGEGVPNAMSHFRWLTDIKKAKFIECDVINSKDGIGICSHVYSSYKVYDSENVEHNIDLATLTWEEIQQYTWTPSTHKYPSEKIIRCEELFKFCRRKNILLWMNCQQTTSETVTTLHNLSVAMGISQNIFWDLHIDDATQNKICNFNTMEQAIDASKYLTSRNQIICDTGKKDFEPSEIENISNKIHSLGMYFSLWTIDDINIANKYLDNGCDFIGTNVLDNSMI